MHDERDDNDGEYVPAEHATHPAPLKYCPLGHDKLKPEK
jgi:hypothetical protein